MIPNPASSADDDLREKILSNPGVILDDPDVMRALVGANDVERGTNVVDLRGIAMDRLEHRLDRLEETHRSVIAAAYDNLAGTNQIHRAVLKILEPTDFESFLKCTKDDISETLRVDFLRLVLETKQQTPDAALSNLSDVLVPAPEGFVSQYVTRGRPRQDRKVTLRQVKPEDDLVYGDAADWIQSEACLLLNFGEGTLPGLLVFGAEDPHQFSSAQGTDLLAFFGTVYERAMRRWLA